MSEVSFWCIWILFACLQNNTQKINGIYLVCKFCSSCLFSQINATKFERNAIYIHSKPYLDQTMWQLHENMALKPVYIYTFLYETPSNISTNHCFNLTYFKFDRM